MNPNQKKKKKINIYFIEKYNLELNKFGKGYNITKQINKIIN